ncbi:MAG: hypothetical protein R3F30_01210 [Planctomycetota bacterium]
MLDLCDELRSIHGKIQDAALRPETLQRLRKRSREKLAELAKSLGTHRFRGYLATVHKDLRAEHFLVLATLLRQHLRGESPYVEGRTLLASVFESSFDLLRGLELLQPDSMLRAHELIEAEQDEESGDDEEDLLELRFRLCRQVVEGFLDEMGIKGRTRGRTRRAYASQREFLVDLKLLHNLHQARSKRLFSQESWWRLRGQEGDRGTRAVTRRIEKLAKEMEQRLSRSPAAVEFPFLTLVRDMGLGHDEVLIVAHLLFLELLEGNPFEDTVVLLQLVSSSEEQLFDKRGLFDPVSTLVRRELVELEYMVEGREMTSECRLASWVVERVFGRDREGRPIDADERLDFHLYLEKLNSSNFLSDI